MFDKVWSALERTATKHKRVSMTLAVMFSVVVYGLAFYLPSRSNDPAPSTSSSTSSCELVWQKHVDNASSYGYAAGDHDSFVSQCEGGATDISSAVN